MQSSNKEIYKLTATRTGKDEKLYKDIGEFVFKVTHEHIKRPKSLILKLKGLGYWFLKKTRMEEILSYYPSYYDIEGYNEFCSENAFLKFSNKKEVYDILKSRLGDYEKYMELKQQMKIKKDEFKKLHEGKEASQSSSEDQPS